MRERTHRSAQGEPSAEDHGTADLYELADQLGELARLLEAEDDTDAMLRELISEAVRLIPGTPEGSLSVVTGRRRVDSQQPSGELPQLIDAIQTETGQGPSLDAVHENQTVRVPDLSVEQRGLPQVWLTLGVGGSQAASTAL